MLMCNAERGLVMVDGVTLPPDVVTARALGSAVNGSSGTILVDDSLYPCINRYEVVEYA